KGCSRQSVHRSFAIKHKKTARDEHGPPAVQRFAGFSATHTSPATARITGRPVIDIGGADALLIHGRIVTPESRWCQYLPEMPRLPDVPGPEFRSASRRGKSGCSSVG